MNGINYTGGSLHNKKNKWANKAVHKAQANHFAQQSGSKPIAGISRIVDGMKRSSKHAQLSNKSTERPKLDLKFAHEIDGKKRPRQTEIDVDDLEGFGADVDHDYSKKRRELDSERLSDPPEVFAEYDPANQRKLDTARADLLASKDWLSTRPAPESSHSRRRSRQNVPSIPVKSSLKRQMSPNRDSRIDCRPLPPNSRSIPQSPSPSPPRARCRDPFGGDNSPSKDEYDSSAADDSLSGDYDSGILEFPSLNSRRRSGSRDHSAPSRSNSNKSSLWSEEKLAAWRSGYSEQEAASLELEEERTWDGERDPGSASISKASQKSSAANSVDVGSRSQSDVGIVAQAIEHDSLSKISPPSSSVDFSDHPAYLYWSHLANALGHEIARSSFLPVEVGWTGPCCATKAQRDQLSPYVIFPAWLDEEADDPDLVVGSRMGVGCKGISKASVERWKKDPERFFWELDGVELELPVEIEDDVEAGEKENEDRNEVTSDHPFTTLLSLSRPASSNLKTSTPPPPKPQIVPFSLTQITRTRSSSPPPDFDPESLQSQSQSENNNNGTATENLSSEEIGGKGKFAGRPLFELDDFAGVLDDSD